MMGMKAELIAHTKFHISMDNRALHDRGRRIADRFETDLSKCW